MLLLVSNYPPLFLSYIPTLSSSSSFFAAVVVTLVLLLSSQDNGGCVAVDADSAASYILPSVSQLLDSSARANGSSESPRAAPATPACLTPTRTRLPDLPDSAHLTLPDPACLTLPDPACLIYLTTPCLTYLTPPA